MEKFLDEVKKMVKKPVTTLMEKEQNEEIKVSGIKTLVVSAVIALVFVLIIMGGIEKSFSTYSQFASLGGTETATALAQAKSEAYAQADLFGWFIKAFIGAVVYVGLVAAVLLVVAKLLKVNKEFKNSLALAANYAIYIGVAFIVYYLLSLISVEVALCGTVLISLFGSYAIKYAYKNSLGNVDDDKLTIFASIVVAVVTIVVGYILYNITISSAISSVTGLGGSSKSIMRSLY